MPFSEGVIISRTLASLQSEQNSTSAVSLDHGWNCFVDHSVSISHFVPGNDCRQIAPPGGYHHCGLATLRPHGIWSCNGLRRQNNEVGYHLLPMLRIKKRKQLAGKPLPATPEKGGKSGPTPFTRNGFWRGRAWEGSRRVNGELKGGSRGGLRERSRGRLRGGLRGRLKARLQGKLQGGRLQEGLQEMA